MNWLDKFEKKHPRFGISNIMLYLVIANAIGYLIARTAPLMFNFLVFDGYHILHGQIWRLITWVFVPSSNGNIFLTALFLLCAISWGRSLEVMIGRCRMTVFVLGGIIISDVGALIYFGIISLVTNSFIPWVNVGVTMPYLTTYYIILTVLMEIALQYHNGIVRLWFIIPMKMIWMFYLILFEMLFDIGSAVYSVFAETKNVTSVLILGLSFTIQIVFALLNMLIFHFSSKNRLSRQQKKRRNEFKQQYHQAAPRPGSGITKHKCAICGKTEVSNPEILFRYCSKCPSGLEYCSDHLFTHTHK